MEQTESRIQQKIVMAVQRQTPGLIFSVPNETESLKELMKKKQTGLLPGASDLIYVGPDKTVIFFEVKTPTGNQSENQERFEKTVKGFGLPYYVVRSEEEVLELIEKHTPKRCQDNPLKNIRGIMITKPDTHGED